MTLRQTMVLVIAAVVVVCGTLASLAFGAVSVPIGDVWSVLTGQLDDGPLKTIVLDLRLPRTIDALAVGALWHRRRRCRARWPTRWPPRRHRRHQRRAFGAILVIVAFPARAGPSQRLVFGLVASAIVFGLAWSAAGGGWPASSSPASPSAPVHRGHDGADDRHPDRWTRPSSSSAAASLGGLGGHAHGGALPARRPDPRDHLIRPLNRLALGDDVAASSAPGRA